MPVWVAAAACAATQRLVGEAVALEQPLVVPEPQGDERVVMVPVRSVAGLADDQQVLGIAVCDPGLGLDLT